MGLILAGLTATGSVLADQWKELFYADALDTNTLMVRGKKKTGRTSSNAGNDNIITNGSGLLVADGQCAIIVDQGEITEVCSEPGYYVYDASTEPTIFCGNLKEGIKASWETLKKRFTYGGDTGKDQRVYFFNTKELQGQKFGTPNPIPFRVVDRNINLDIDMSVRCSGTYSIRLADPILFYKNVAGNVASSYTVDQIATTLKTEFMSALQPAFGNLSEMQIRPNVIPQHVTELCFFLNSALTEKWGPRGFEVANIAMNPVTLPEEDQETLKKLQVAGALRDTNMAGATITAAQADAMRDAAKNEGGAMNGFFGMNMAMNAGSNAQGLFAMGQNAQADSWKCSCGAVNSGNFCTNCGQPKPQQAAGAFCPSCGKPVPAGAAFCPNCGKPIA